MRTIKMPTGEEFKVYEPEVDFVRASQDALCEKCGIRLGDHLKNQNIIGYNFEPFLNEDCLGRLYKL